MYDSLVGHIVRRGVHVAHKCGGMKGVKAMMGAPPPSHIDAPNGHGGHPHELPAPVKEIIEKLKSPAAVITIFSTIAVILFLDFVIHYTLGDVATNLTIAEDPEPTGAIRFPLNDPSIAKVPLLKDGGNGTVVIEEFGAAKPITASLRGTLRHIRSIGGFSSYFRGIRYAMFYKLIFFCFFGVFSGLLPFFVGRVVAVIATSALTCNLHAAWTQATVSAPSEYTRRGFFAKFLPRSTAKHLILPTVRYLIAVNLTGFAVRQAVHSALPAHHGMAVPYSEEKKLGAILAVVGSLIIGLVGAFGAIIPAHIALVRAELAYLPEEAPVVVPFDRTFGGRINIEANTTGTWKAYIFRNLSMRGAYATFDKAAYKRVLKMLAKTVGLQIVVGMLAAAVLVAEFYVFVGKEVKELAITMKHH